MRYARIKSKKRAGGMLCAAVVVATNACSVIVNTSVPDDGNGGRPRSSGGANNAAGNHAGGRGGRNSGGDAGEAAGMLGSGGDIAPPDGSGGAAFSGAAGQDDGGASAGGAFASGGSAVHAAGGVQASGGTTQSGGASTTGGTLSASSGGKAASGGTGMGGTGMGGLSSGGGGTGPCLGKPNELVTQGWYINTGNGSSATIQPQPTGSDSGLFQDGSCACVSGSRGSGYANVYFQPPNGELPFTSLSIKLINASPDFAWPTLHVWPKNAEHPYCRSLSKDQIDKLNNGQTLTISNTEFYLRQSGVCSGPQDMPAGEPITSVHFQVDTTQDKLDFNFCVLKLTVNP